MVCCPSQRGRRDFSELGRLMKAVGAQRTKASQSSKSDEAETEEVRDQRASCRSTAKDLFKHLKEVLDKTDVPTADQPPGASDGSLFGAPSPPSVVPTVPSNGGEVAGVAAAMAYDGGEPIEHTTAIVAGVGTPSAALGEALPALSLTGQAEVVGADVPKLSLPKDVQRGSGNRELSVFAGAESDQTAASSASKDGATIGLDGSQGAPFPSASHSLPIPRRQPLRSPAAGDKPRPTSGAASSPCAGSPPAVSGKQPSGLLLPRRQEPALPGAVASESPRRTASPLAPTSSRLLLSPRPPAPPGVRPPLRAHQHSSGQAGFVHVSDQPRGRVSLLSPHDGKALASGAFSPKVFGGSVYDAVTEDTGLHEYEPMTPGRGVLRSALNRRGGQRSVKFGVDKTWILPPLSAASSPAREADEAAMDEDNHCLSGADADDDGDSVDVGLASKVRNKDVESEAKHFRARHVAPDSQAVDALLTLTLRRAFEYFSNTSNLRSDPTPAQLWEVMQDITGSCRLEDLKQV